MFQVNVDLPTDPRDGRFVAGPDGTLFAHDAPEANFATREQAEASAAVVAAAHPEAMVAVVGPFAISSYPTIIGGKELPK